MNPLMHSSIEWFHQLNYCFIAIGVVLVATMLFCVWGTLHNISQGYRSRRWLLAVALMALGAVAGLSITMLGIKGEWDLRSTTFDEEAVEEEVVWSRRIVAFERDADSLTTGVADATVTNFLFYKRASVSYRKMASYVVMEDRSGNGGLVEASYPTTGTVVFEDASAEDARVEEVETRRVRVKGHWLGNDFEYFDVTTDERRIHVPEGTLDMARIADADEGEEGEAE